MPATNRPADPMQDAAIVYPTVSEPLASQISALRAGQKILVVSRRADGTRELISRYTIKRIGGAGWYVELEGPMGGDASIVVVEATRKVALCRGREERVVTFGAQRWRRHSRCSVSLRATIAAAAAEHVGQRGEAALADAYAVFATASERYGISDLVRVDRAGLAEALDWLDESLERRATKAERLLYALEIRVVAQQWTRNAIADAEFHDESSAHLRWDLSADAGRDWDTSTTLPASREAVAARDRARKGLSSTTAKPAAAIRAA